MLDDSSCDYRCRTDVHKLQTRIPFPTIAQLLDCSFADNLDLLNAVRTVMRTVDWRFCEAPYQWCDPYLPPNSTHLLSPPPHPPHPPLTLAVSCCHSVIFFSLSLFVSLSLSLLVRLLLRLSHCCDVILSLDEVELHVHQQRSRPSGCEERL